MARQSLAPRSSDAVAQVVRRSAGIQAQVQSAAVLAVAQRRAAPRRGEVDRALCRDRAIVKTSAMRGTRLKQELERVRQVPPAPAPDR